MMLTIISLGQFFKIAMIIVIITYLISVNLGSKSAKSKSYKSQNKGFFSAFRESNNAMSIDKTIELIKNENINVSHLAKQSMPRSQAADKQQQ